MSDVIYEVVESKELTQGQLASLSGLVSAAFGVPAGQVQGLSIVKEEDEDGNVKYVCSARIYKKATAEVVLDELEAGKVSRIVKRDRE